MTLEQITSIAFSTKLDAKVDTTQSSNLLDRLSEQKFKIINRHRASVGSHMSTYSINMGNLLYAIWLKNVEALIQKKFGNVKYVRVFRALQVLEIASEQQLEEACLLDLKEVRGVIMELFKEELLQMHEVPGKKTSFAFSIIFEKYVKKLTELLFKVNFPYIFCF